MGSKLPPSPLDVLHDERADDKSTLTSLQTGRSPERRSETLGQDVQTLKINLALYLFNERLLVIDQQAIGGEEVSRSQQRLLANMLRAIEFDIARPVHQQRFVWPMVANQRLGNSVAETQAALQAFLRRQYGAFTLQAALVLGADAAFALQLGEARELAAYRGDTRQSAALPCPLVVSYALADVLQQPSLKPQVWQDLLKLRELLRHDS